jgi:hypothetical protein
MTVAQGGMWIFYLMNRILIHVPEKDNHGSFEETERLDKEMVERWLGEADSVIIFVSAGSTILGTFPSKEHVLRLLCSRLSAQSPSLKATSGYHLTRATRPSIYSMRRSTYSLKKSTLTRQASRVSLLRVTSHSIEQLMSLRSTSYGSAVWSSA